MLTAISNCLIWLNGFSQNQSLIVVIDSPIIHQINLSKKTQLLIDTTAAFSLENAKTKSFLPISAYKCPEFLRKEAGFQFWLKTIITNNTSDTVRFLYSGGDHYKSNLYLEKIGKITEKYSTGQHLLPHERLYRYDYQYFPIKISPHETLTLFQSFQTLTGKIFTIKPHLISYESEAQTKVKLLYDDYYLMAQNNALCAVLLFVCVFFLLQYALTHQKFLFYYSLYLFFILCFASYGFSFSPYVVHFFSFSDFFKFSIRQNFYMLGTNFCYFLFLYEMLNVKHHERKFIKRFFEFALYGNSLFIVVELFFSIIYRSLDIEIFWHFISQFYVSGVGIIYLIVVFFFYNQKVSVYIKIGSFLIVLAAIIGFLSSNYQLVPQSSALFTYYPNVYFNYFVFLEILFFSLAIGEKTFENIKDKNRLQQSFAMSELDILRSQINPHFLFNSLNSIKSYIIKNQPKIAANYLTDFSVLIRSILEKSREQFQSLAEELTIVELYIKLEQKRFEGKFDYKITIDEAIYTEIVKIPAFLLQPFVENSIKHGFKGLKITGKLEISITRNDKNILITIQDNGIGRENASKIKLLKKGHHSLGVQLIENRLKLLKEIHQWDIRYSIEDLSEPLGTRVKLKIPDFE